MEKNQCGLFVPDVIIGSLKQKIAELSCLMDTLQDTSAQSVAQSEKTPQEAPQRTETSETRINMPNSVERPDETKEIVKNRRFFTKQITKLLQEMIDDGETPIIDYCLRSKEEQKRLYDAGLSKCNGTDKISQHQKAKAIDIYLVDKKGNAEFEWVYVKAIKWHTRAEELGFDKMIKWDLCHFQVS